jgi:hypothetical protein
VLIRMLREAAREAGLDPPAGGGTARRGVVGMTSFRVTATRESGWWSLVAHDVGGREVASQSRRLDRAEAAIRAAIALVLDADPATFEVTVVPDVELLPVSEAARETVTLRRDLRELEARTQRATPLAVAELRDAGLTARDVAHLLDMTPSRVSQIEQRARMRA